MRSPDWNRWVEDSKECEFWLKSYMRRRVIAKRRNDSISHLTKVDHNIRLAVWLTDKHNSEVPALFGAETFYDWIVCAYYYAIYHAALALVSSSGYRSESHSATLCFLIHYYYHQKKELDKNDITLLADSLSKEDIAHLGHSKELREKASYDVHYLFEKGIADMVRAQAGSFISKVKLILHSAKD